MDISDASVGILGQDGSIINKMVSLRKQEMGKLRNVALVGLEKASLQFKALLLELLCWSIEPRTGLMFQEYVHGLMTTRMEPQTLSWGREDSQVHLKFFYSEFMQFSLEDERFLVKHRWKRVQRYSKEAMKNKNPLLEKINEKKLQNKRPCYKTWRFKYTRSAWPDSHYDVTGVAAFIIHGEVRRLHCRDDEKHSVLDEQCSSLDSLWSFDGLVVLGKCRTKTRKTREKIVARPLPSGANGEGPGAHQCGRLAISAMTDPGPLKSMSGLSEIYNESSVKPSRLF
ncbi:hypothetical protein Bca52824_003175 [Brassica carinata]|uniref:Uncharacterized protein n=1 Tax=Brassica carinata TaxID=52824 RepID=A0A8X7WNE9_BRACI|nr:hypothetical protein Bca52824_003175 [Brassica carinata]